ncbi:MAG: sodium:dicarboxylate symporter [Chlamydiales bacterium]|nr:sodium:dicarboxylate symporter [Chlamydiales bacterium]
MKLWMRILAAMFLGVLVGAVLGPKATYLQPLGSIFLGLINMLIVPLVFSSMTVGITSIHDPKKLGRVGIKSILIFVSTTMVAIVLGLSFAYIGKPGIGIHMEIPGGAVAVENRGVVETPNLWKVLKELIPSNPIASMAEGNILQIIIFSLFLGMAIIASKEKGQPFLKVLESLADIMLSLTGIVMEFSPIGVFAIMAWVSGSFGVKVLLPLLQFLGLYYLASLVHLFFVYFAMLKFIGGLSPIPFLKGMGDAIMLAFSTTSSSATLPASLHCVQQNLGVSKNIANFILPLGSTINMNGAALFQGMTAVFLSQVYGIELSWTSILMVVFTATLSAVGAAGIPGASLLMLSVVLGPIGIPMEGIAILAGIDRIREMISTVINVLGDSLCAVLVAKSEGELDIDRYYQIEIIKFEQNPPS